MFTASVPSDDVFLTPHQEEGRTALALALMEQRQDIADLILSIDQADVKHAHATVSFHTL